MATHFRERDSLNLLDFGIIGEEFSISGMLRSSYFKGREDFKKEIEAQFLQNFQSAAHSSSLLKSKLSEHGIRVHDLFLKVEQYQVFECLVVLHKDDYYDKAKRWESYKISESISDTISQIDLKFSFTGHSDSLDIDNIISEGFVVRYESEKI